MTDPYEEADKLEELYEEGYCYDCGELACKKCDEEIGK
jgi:hypothetical protein